MKEVAEILENRENYSNYVCMPRKGCDFLKWEKKVDIVYIEIYKPDYIEKALELAREMVIFKFSIDKFTQEQIDKYKEKDYILKIGKYKNDNYVVFVKKEIENGQN